MDSDEIWTDCFCFKFFFIPEPETLEPEPKQSAIFAA